MNRLLKKVGLGVALAATALTAAAPADAQRWHRSYRGGYHGYHHGGNAAGAAILGGIVGLGVGAAIASSNRDRYYRGGYSDRGYYPRAGYAYDYPQRRCWRERRFDPYYGYAVPVRVCG